MSVSNNTFMIPQKSLLYFKIDNDLFAIETKYIIETLSFSKITKVPQATKNAKGIVNFRGDILPIIDVKKKIYNDENAESTSNNVVVVEVNNNDLHQTIGFIVDKVIGVLDIPLTKVQTIPEIDCKYQVKYMSGMFELNGEFVMIINVDLLFSLQEIVEE